MELAAFFRPLIRWWWLLLASVLLAAVSTYLLVRRQPPLYQTSTTLMIGRAFDDPNPRANDLALGQQLAETYADLAQREPVRAQTRAALGLAALPEYSAVPLPNRQLLRITVVDTDPRRAQAVADELANQLVLQSPTAPKPEEQERQAFINSQLASLQENIRQTEAEIAAKQVELEGALGALEIGALQGEIRALQTKLSTLQANYAALLANTTGGAINTIQIIEPAALPTAPISSGAAPLILVVSAIALVLAAGTAYLLDYLDDTVRTAGDLDSVDGYTSLPGIPEFSWDGNIVPVLSREAPHSPVADAFRALRTGLYAAAGARAGRVFLITSAAPKEGKSVVAANLAAVLAQGEKSVVLIDADLRRPTQHKLFEVSGAYGLAELLLALHRHDQANGRAELVQRAIQWMGPMRLGLIVGGESFAEAGRLIGSDSMKVLLEIVSRQADYVIVDSPPLLAVADALMLSIQVDGVVLVASAGSVPRRQLEQSLRRLRDVGANVVGVVLNRQKAALDGYGFPYYLAYTDQNQ